jgi:predicted porin
MVQLRVNRARLSSTIGRHEGVVMKRALLYGTALAGAAASASAAEASDGIKLEVGGFFRMVYQGVFDKKAEDHFGNHRNTDAFNHNGEVWFKGETTLDNGLTIGAHVELEAENANDQIDQSFIYWQGGFGKVQIGSQDKAIANHCLLPPGATDNFSAFSPNSWGSNDPIGSNAACVDTEDNDQGIVYSTPNFDGFQLFVSYTPSNNAEDYTQVGVNGSGTPSNPDGTAHHTFSAYATYSYAGDGWGLDWGGGGSWQLKFNGTDGANDGKTEEYQTGLNLTIGSFAVGGVMEYFNEGGNDNDAYVAGGGFSYTTDPWVFGMQASHGHFMGTDAFSLTPNPGGSRNLNRVIGTVNYAMAPGIMLDGELGYTWFSDSGDGVPGDQDHYHAFNIAIGSSFMF